MNFYYSPIRGESQPRTPRRLNGSLNNSYVNNSFCEAQNFQVMSLSLGMDSKQTTPRCKKNWLRPGISLSRGSLCGDSVAQFAPLGRKSWVSEQTFDKQSKKQTSTSSDSPSKLASEVSKMLMEDDIFLEVSSDRDSLSEDIHILTREEQMVENLRNQLRVSKQLIVKCDNLRDIIRSYESRIRQTKAELKVLVKRLLARQKLNHVEF